MSRQLHISKELSLPIDAATQTFALIGRKGGGKTYCAGKLAELFIGAGVHTIILDLVGKWWGLRLAADGRSPGIDIPMFGGLRGDIPLEASGGALLAEALHESGSNAILDLSQFSKADRQKFCYQFGERLWRLKKSEMNPTPIHLMIEESQLIVPENIPTGSKHDFMTLMYGTFEEIIRLGRNYGIGITMITQRPQSVAKEVLNQSEPLLVFQLIGAHERKAIKLWIQHQGLDESLLDTLPSLTKGECWFWSPEWLQTLERIHIAEKWTFDSTATPKVGEKHVKAREIKSLDLSDLRQRMKETIERQKQDDPKELRKTIGELRGQIKKIESAKPQTVTETKTKTEIKTVEKRIVITSDITRLEKLHADMAVPIERLETILERAHQERSHIAVALTEARELNATNMIALAPAIVTPAPSLRARQTEGYAPPTPHRQLAAQLDRAETNGDGDLAKGPLKLLRSIVQFGRVTRDQLTLLSGYTQSSRDTYLKVLSSQGLVVYPERGEVEATEAGREAAGEVEELPTGQDLIDWWLARLPSGHAKVFQAVVSENGSPISRQKITELTGYTQSSRDTYIKKLKTRRLIRIPSPGMIAPAEFLFQ